MSFDDWMKPSHGFSDNKQQVFCDRYILLCSLPGAKHLSQEWRVEYKPIQETRKTQSPTRIAPVLHFESEQPGKYEAAWRPVCFYDYLSVIQTTIPRNMFIFFPHRYHRASFSNKLFTLATIRVPNRQFRRLCFLSPKSSSMGDKRGHPFFPKVD